MGFFDDVDEDRVVENHAQQVKSMQGDAVSDLVSNYRDARLELQDRLNHVRADSFTAQHLRGMLAQVNAALHSMHADVLDDMDQNAQDAATLGVEHTKKELRHFSEKYQGAVQSIPLDAVKVALDTKNFLVNQYDASIKTYDQDIRNQITRGLTQSVIQGLPYSDVVKKVAEFFQGTQWKLEQIVRTEMHHVYSQGKLESFKDVKKSTLKDLKKALYHPMDERTGEDSIELSEENPILPLDESFKQTYTPIKKNGQPGKTQVYVFMSPPNRPNDRAILIPYRDAWDEN